MSNGPRPHLPLYIVDTKTRTKHINVSALPSSEGLFVLEPRKGKGCNQVSVRDEFKADLPIFNEHHELGCVTV